VLVAAAKKAPSGVNARARTEESIVMICIGLDKAKVFQMKTFPSSPELASKRSPGLEEGLGVGCHFSDETTAVCL